MKRRKIALLQLYKIRHLIKRFAIVFVFIASFVVILLNKSQNVFLEHSSSYLTDATSSLLEVVVLPARLFSKGYDKVIDVKNVYEKNKQLEKESKELVVLKNNLAALEVENALLSKLLNYKKAPEENYVTARVVAEEENAFSQSLIAYVGDAEVKKGDVVLSDKGVVGRVESVGLFYAKILQATDINSKIPVLVQSNSFRAVLVGDNTNYPYLEFLPIGVKVNIGDDVVTSGVGGFFPSDLVVGKVFSVDKNGIRVKLVSDFSSLEYVKIVDYGL